MEHTGHTNGEGMRARIRAFKAEAASGSQLGPHERVAEDGELMIRVNLEPELAILSVYGEIDLANAKTLEGEVRRQEETIESGTIIVDLSAIGFIDTTGISTLVAAQARAREGAWAFGLLRPTGEAARALELTGLDQVLFFLD